MRNNHVKSLLIIAGILAMLATLFSFASVPGGDVFSISLNDKVVIQQALHVDKSIKTLSLGESSVNDEMSVMFSHCGEIGTARNLELRDARNNVVKSWHFPDAVETTGKSMKVKVKDIIAMQKSGTQRKFSLFYSATELKDGMVLATIDISGDTKASLR